MGAATFEQQCVLTCSASVHDYPSVSCVCDFPRISRMFTQFFPAVFGTISCPDHGAHHRRSHSREQSLRRKRRHEHSLATQAQTQLHRHKPKHYAGRTPRGAQRRYGKKKVHPGRERGSVRFAAFPFSFLLSEGICHHHSPPHPPLQCCPCSLSNTLMLHPHGGVTKTQPARKEKTSEPTLQKGVWGKPLPFGGSWLLDPGSWAQDPGS